MRSMPPDPRRLPWILLRAARGRVVGARWVLSVYGVSPVRAEGLLLHRVRRHRGPAVTLADGSLVAPGDPVVELHLDNRALLAARAQPGYSTWTAVAALRADLRALAGARIDAAALHGVSLLGAAGGYLGFETRPVRRGPREALVRYFMAGVDAVYHPDGLRRLEGRSRDRRPVEAWMSWRRLAELYGNARPY